LFVEEPFLDHARIRLKPNGIDDGGYWWSFDNPEGPYEIVQLLKTEGVSFFNRYLPFPGELDQLNEKLIMEGRSQGILPSLLKGRALLVLAKYCEYVERIPMCVSVAKTGSGHD
jgi:hypothetical protein